MSYDLFLRPRSPNSHDSIRDYFRSRAFYQIHENQTQIHYSNPDTGVYFGFHLHGLPAPKISNDEIAPSDDFPVAFNMNYYRPHFFGLEAEPEITAFVGHFTAEIYDPQMNGMADGPYTPQGFLKAWNHGNMFSYSAILESPNAPVEVLSLPSDQLRKIWNWNYSRNAEQARRGEKIFVPRIMALAATPSPVTFAVWPEDAPIYMPRTDLLALHRFATASAGSGEKGDMAFVPFESLEPLISHHRVGASPGSFAPYHVATFTPALREAFRNAPARHTDQRGIPLDQILDRELVLKSRPPHPNP